jgi:hypothetical protein
VAICVAAGALAAAATWLMLSGGDAQDMAPAISAPLASVPTGAVAAAPAHDGVMRGGVGVRGRWTLEVRNPDGTLDRREEFENALKNDGYQLARGLTTHRHLAAWEVRLDVSNTQGAPPRQVILHEAGIAPQGDQAYKLAFPNLVVTADKPSANPSSMFNSSVWLKGSFIADEALTYINYVYTITVVCKAPDLCIAEGQQSWTSVTEHSLYADVLPGQQIMVTVELAFETAS